MGVGGVSRLFRDFVEKLERAYIAFDGVVGSCLGRAWGGPPTTTWTTTLTLFRETQNPISQNAPHSLSSSPSLLSSTYCFVFTFRPSRVVPFIASSRVPFSSFLFIWLSDISEKDEFNSSFVYPIHLWIKSLSLFLFFSLFFSFSTPFSFLSLILTLCTSRCISFPFLELPLSGSISILGWVNAYSKQQLLRRYS